MKIGIITLHRTTNYGATLQAYSLWKFLTDKGHEVELIDYSSNRLGKAYNEHLYRNKFFAFNMLKAYKMKRFLQSNVELSDKRFCTESEMLGLNSKYDAVICGSDEIWNVNSSLLGFDSNFFLGFVSSSSVRKISYAPSFGSTTKLGNYKANIANALKDFSAISVRDSNSIRLVRDQCNASSVKVLDPTFLSNYKSILRRPRIAKNYVLIYGGLSVEEREYVKQVANAENLTTIAVGYPCKTAKINRLDASPEEWLGLFSEARYVFTNFYHGVIFSLIFRKPFTAFSRLDKSIKIQDLLGDIGLKDRILEPTLVSSLRLGLDFSLDFDELALNSMIQKSKLYLDQSLRAADN